MKNVPNLNPKQQAEFKSIVKLLDNKEYKKGLKQITKLAQTVDAPEVNSLKAIFLYNNNEKTEGLALAKSALMKGIKSDFCWHIYGLVNKAEKNYPEAIKCFIQALKNDNDNLQLIKDLSNLQLHVRDYEGHAETRRQLLQAKSAMVVNWIGYIVGNHLNGNLTQASEVLKSTKNIIANQTNQDQKLKPVEENELALYEARLNYELQNYSEALKVLEEQKAKITDQLAQNELLFDIYEQQGDKQRAEEHIMKLVELQPQNWNYYNRLFKLHNLSESQPKELAQFFREKLQYKNNSLLQSRLLGYVDVSEFKDLFVEFITPYFTRALPSLFREIIHLYNDAQKVLVMEEVYQTFKASQDLTSPLWAQMLLAQHYCHIGKYTEAHQNIEEAIKHTPTLHELYLVKAKILKKQCNFVEAFHVTDQVRKLDLADRYLNNKAIKYALRANLIYQAQDLIRLFLRDSTDSNPHEIQTIWYELAMGKSYLRLRHYGQSFRMFKFIEKHYQEMYEDQVDFYSYAMRRYSFRSLFDMMKSLDTTHNSKYYIVSAGELIKGLLDYIKVLQSKKQQTDENTKKKLTAAEKKKLQKQQLKDEEEQELKKAFCIDGHIYTLEQRQKLDLGGEQILATLKDQNSVLAEVNQISKILINTSNTTNKQACLKAFKNLVEFYIFSKKPTLAVKLLKKLRYYDQSVVSHKYQLKLLDYLSEGLKEKRADVTLQEVLEQEVASILNGRTVAQYNQDFFAQNKPEGLLAQVIHLQCECVLKKVNQDEEIKQLNSLIRSQPDATVQDIYRVLEDNHQLVDPLKDFLNEKHPLLFTHYHEDPNLRWQEQQIAIHRAQKEETKS